MKIGHTEKLGNNSLIVIEELIYLISPSSGIIAIKPGKKIKSHSADMYMSPPLLHYHCLQTHPGTSFLHGHDYMGSETTTRCNVDVLEVGDSGLPPGFSTYQIPSSIATGNQYFGLHGELHAAGENLGILLLIQRAGTF